MDLHYVTTQIDFFKMNQLDINSFTLYLDNKLEEKIKEGKEKGREIGAFSFQILPILEGFVLFKMWRSSSFQSSSLHFPP